MSPELSVLRTSRCWAVLQRKLPQVVRQLVHAAALRLILQGVCVCVCEQYVMNTAW